MSTTTHGSCSTPMAKKSSTNASVAERAGWSKRRNRFVSGPSEMRPGSKSPSTMFLLHPSAATERSFTIARSDAETYQSIHEQRYSQHGTDRESRHRAHSGRLV